MSSSYRQVLRSSINDPVSSRNNYDKSKSPVRAIAAFDPPASPEVARSPPEPPRSAFMCFTEAKKKEIMMRRGIVEENDDILNVVAEEWKRLSDKDRAHWDEESRNDKVRYVRAKALYKGPDLIPKRRAKKHPMAPKRPMSAFLKFSQTRRQRVKKENPDMSNTDVSRLLGEMWRNASPKEKAPYREQEERERAIYKENIKKFKNDQARVDVASRTSHQSVHGYRNHRHNHAMEDYGTHSQRSFPSSMANTFEILRVDSFEEPVSSHHHSRPSHFRSQYSSHSYPHSYHQTYPISSESASLQHHDYHDDPLQVIPGRARLPSPPKDEFDSIADHYVGNRSSYFHDNMNPGYYSRYP